MRSVALMLALAATTAYAVNVHSDVHKLGMIDMINKKNVGWTAGINERFAGAKIKDVLHLMGTYTKGDKYEAAMAKLDAAPAASNIDLPAEFDAAKAWPACASVIGHVRDQASCGSCWAFGSTEALNDRLCIAHNVTVELSAQDTASCCNLFGGCFGSQGCNGGIPAEAWSYFVQTGVVTGGDYDSKEGCFPYEIPNCDHHEGGPYPPCTEGGSTPACPNPKACTNAAYHTAWSQDKHYAKSSYSLPSVQQIQESLFKEGSVTAAFSVYEDFLTYKSGVYTHQTGGYLGGHAVKIQGWGVENGQAYWLVENSWNTNWGDNGYFKIARGTDECGIESQVVAGSV